MGRSGECVVRWCPATGRLRGQSGPRRRGGPTQGHDDHAGRRLAQRQPEVGGRLRVRRRIRVECRAQWWRARANNLPWRAATKPRCWLSHTACKPTGCPTSPNPTRREWCREAASTPARPVSNPPARTVGTCCRTAANPPPPSRPKLSPRPSSSPSACVLTAFQISPTLSLLEAVASVSASAAVLVATSTLKILSSSPPRQHAGAVLAVLREVFRPTANPSRRPAQWRVEMIGHTGSPGFQVASPDRYILSIMLRKALRNERVLSGSSRGSSPFPLASTARTMLP